MFRRLIKRQFPNRLRFLASAKTSGNSRRKRKTE
jgi:hypothetical protein